MGEKLSPPTAERRLWKGPDIVIRESVVLPPSQLANIPIIITRESLPPDTFPSRNPNLSISTRSRIAQVGVEARGITGNRYLANSFVTVFNHCKRPVQLCEDLPVFRFFQESPGSAIRGTALVDLLKEEKLKIEGKEGEDWEWSKKNNPSGLFLRIYKEGRKWIPPDPNNTSIIIDGTSTDYREIIDQLSEPITPTADRILWIGETPKVTLAEDLEALLGKMAFNDFRNIRQDNVGTQINSRLIDGGRTYWGIRVEILSATTEDKIPNFVHLRLFRNGIKNT